MITGMSRDMMAIEGLPASSSHMSWPRIYKIFHDFGMHAVLPPCVVQRLAKSAVSQLLLKLLDVCIWDGDFESSGRHSLCILRYRCCNGLVVTVRTDGKVVSPHALY